MTILEIALILIDNLEKIVDIRSYVNGYNECMTSTINLITGETDVSNGPCWINL